MTDDADALEIISILVRSGGMDPKIPRGTKPGIGIADITGALHDSGDVLGADMALAIATQDWRMGPHIREYLERYVRCTARRSQWLKREPDVLAIYRAVYEAFDDVMMGKPNGHGGSKYYRWARGEFWGRALNAAIAAKRHLHQRVA